jgi:cold shock CspA family protein/ribosome-associated translation inhibitor RaiA
MHTQIESRNVDMTARWRSEIEARLTDLRTGHDALTHVRVTLTRHDHRKAADTAEALIVATLPGRTLTARKTEATFEEAIRDAFAAIAVELEKYRDKRGSHEIRAASVPLRGVVTKVFAADGYGFIRLDSGEDVYFHRHAVHGFAFEELEDGMAVSLNSEMGEKGLQATTVNPLPPAEHYANKAGRVG